MIVGPSNLKFLSLSLTMNFRRSAYISLDLELTEKYRFGRSKLEHIILGFLKKKNIFTTGLKSMEWKITAQFKSAKNHIEAIFKM